MKILNLYAPIRESMGRGYQGYTAFEVDPCLQTVHAFAKSWEINQGVVDAWFQSPDAIRQEKLAFEFLGEAPHVVERVENIFGRELPGELLLMPSFGDFDGFARYDQGSHRVLLGIDFPDANLEYLKALTAHELSHVYRDHSPEVWRHLGKPLAEVSRAEYLEATDADEHLVSEGLATLFSQFVFPEIHPRVHHYYEEEEWEWCLRHEKQIEVALIQCLKSDADVWSFYGESRAAPGSPSRTQYFWAAKKLEKILSSGPDRIRALIDLHEKPAIILRDLFLTF